VRRQAMTLTEDGGEIFEDPENDFIGFAVDAGTACFIDELAVQRAMPDREKWGDEIFENDDPNCWFNLMDNPNHIRAGLANIDLPLATDCSNVVIIQSGHGDGVYPVVGGFDAAGRLVAVHIDFMVA
jgi:uncharacterized protein DUF4241